MQRNDHILIETKFIRVLAICKKIDLIRNVTYPSKLQINTQINIKNVILRDRINVNKIII